MEWLIFFYQTIFLNDNCIVCRDGYPVFGGQKTVKLILHQVLHKFQNY